MQDYQEEIISREEHIKMTNKFVLSEKIAKEEVRGTYEDILFAREVKEFIQLLKEEIEWINGDYKTKCECLDKINNLAGTALTGQEKTE